MTIHRDMFKNSKTQNEQEQIDAAFAADEPWPEGPLKDMLLEYVGTKHDSEEVTVEMIVEQVAEEFPEFLMAVAEENWIRGYKQAIHDVDQGQRMLAERAESNEQ
tara:strand:- start:880 stop:1194 length:315 start_codon:yes stop_codon:yes gene_type:complete